MLPTQSVSIGDILGILPDSPVSTTRGRSWPGITLDVYKNCHGYSVHTPPHDHHLICYCPSGGARLVQRRGGIVHESVFSAGTSLVMPAGEDSVWEGDAPASARMRIPPDLVRAASEQIGIRAVNRIEIHNVFEARDPFIERSAWILLTELDRAPHPTQLLIADVMSCALAAHMLRSYNVFAMPAPAAPASSLGKAELRRVAEFVEENIDRPIGLAELAQLVGVSRFHFSRIFKQSTGMTPTRYVEDCRIRRARDYILGTSLSLSDIALMLGFADQSHFTRRFRMHAGCTPAAFAREQGKRRSRNPAREDLALSD